MISLKLNSPVRIIESELEQFHFNNGSSTLLPELRKKGMKSDLVLYEIIDKSDNSMKSSILLQPTSDGSCKMSAHVNDSERWAWLLGVPGRGELGVTTYLGAETSPSCKDFCDRFIEHLRLSGYVGNTNLTNERIEEKSLHEEDVWAWRQYHRTNQPVLDIYDEWIQKREKANRISKFGTNFDPRKRFDEIIQSDQLEKIETE